MFQEEEEDMHIVYACAKCQTNNTYKNEYISTTNKNYNKQLEQQQIFTYAPASVTNKNAYRNMCWDVKNPTTCNLQLNYIFILLYCLTCFCLAVNGATTGSLTTSSHKQHRQTGLYAWNNFTDIEHDSEVAKEKERYDNNDFDSDSSVLVPTTNTYSNTECPLTTSSHCLRCNVAGCIKCPMYIMTDTRQCVDQCPSGYIDQWSAHTEFMGRVCISTGYSGPIMAALAGMLGGFVFCLTLLGFAIMLMRRKRRRKTIKQKLINEHTMDRADFLRQLNDMRPNAEYFLAMLNDTRRQIRKLYLAGDVNAANAYRPVVRDLAKILILLNRPIELIPSAPHDWNRIYTWADQALERYKPQVGQLIDLFQPAAIDTDHASDDPEANLYRPKGNSSVFKQNAVQQLNAGTIRTNGTTHKMHMFGSLISLHEFEEPRPSDPFGSSFNTLKSGNLITDLNASSLWLEDEFYKLGFRPQDEITTEL